MDTVDTIAAICTGAGGAISIIRISGEDALNIGNNVWKGSQQLSLDNKRKMLFGKTQNPAGEGDTSLAVYMPGPNSFTGEDVVEIHSHGGSLCAREILSTIINSGARLAQPGEFSYRAFINGKMDLTQAEAIADVINAHSKMALHIAEKQVAGNLKDKISSFKNTIYEILADIESRLDFADVELEWDNNSESIEKIQDVIFELSKLLATKKEGAILREGVRVVIAGKPNVGKSSLLNRILGYERAIVTEIEGTTRDTLEEFVTIRNIPVNIIDTAGLRESVDFIEGIGIERSKQSLKLAQIVIWLFDITSSSLEDEIKYMNDHISEKENVIVLWNKLDAIEEEVKPPNIPFTSRLISVKEDIGIENFLDDFEKMVWGFKHTEEPEYAVSERHAELITKTIEALPNAINLLETEDYELASVYLREAMNAIGSITGETVEPDILDNIFSKFCLGK